MLNSLCFEVYDKKSSISSYFSTSNDDVLIDLITFLCSSMTSSAALMSTKTNVIFSFLIWHCLQTHFLNIACYQATTMR